MRFPAVGWIRGVCAAMVAAAIGVVGCQSQIGGQVLPSPYSAQQDDVQYYPPGPEYKLSREAAAQKAYEAELRRKVSESRAAGMPSHSCPHCSAH